MITYNKKRPCDFEAIPIDPFWNTSEESEHRIHRIHAYPAKFPAFLTTRAIEHATKMGLHPRAIADVFCGCGTVSYEAARNDIDFWGCDLNPVATLIANVKSKKYQGARLQSYFRRILTAFNRAKAANYYADSPERLRYWYKKRQYNDLFLLRRTIERTVPASSEYRLFFLCAFSNILKATSKWLTKSIKPQIDPNKKPADVICAFTEQVTFMIAANDESRSRGNTHSMIVTANFLAEDAAPPEVDLVITSPPYVTSYDYADLHQLSSLWLRFVDDYRNLRKGSIGGASIDFNFKKQLKNLNKTGSQVVFKLIDKKHANVRAVTKYFLDMQQVAMKCHRMLRKNGMALFVVGNTEYKGVRIENAQHLAESMADVGFRKIKISKRRISNKILTPYRDCEGRFTTDGTGRKVYSEEFILVGHK